MWRERFGHRVDAAPTCQLSPSRRSRTGIDREKKKIRCPRTDVKTISIGTRAVDGNLYVMYVYFVLSHAVCKGCV